jgi:poly(A) polymerase
VETGKSFGVVRVLTGEGESGVEVATFRKESGYQDHRHPSRVEFSGVQEDASRRDFTVNALYIDLKSLQILDLHEGIRDLREKTIRAVGDPAQRFKEDALRLLRAIRFAGRLGFRIEESTRQAIALHASLIKKVSVERIREELEKMWLDPSPKQAWLDLEETGLLEFVLPEICTAKIEQKKVRDQTLRVLGVLSRTPRQERAVFYWSLLLLPTFRLHPIEKRETESRKVSKRLKFSTGDEDLMAYLVRETPKFREAFSMRESTLLRWMRHPEFETLMRFHELDAISYDGNLAGLEFVRSVYPEARKRFERKPLLTGEALVGLGMQPGPRFSEILRAVEDLALEGALSTEQEALEFVLNRYVK